MQCQDVRMYLCIIIDEYQYFCKNIICVILSAVFVLKCEWLKYFFDLTKKYFILTANFTWNKRKPYICIRVYICCAFTWPKIHICIKYIYANANIHLVWAGVYLHGVYICTCANQVNFYIYAIAFTCPKIHPGANYTYMYNLHTVCKSAHVNGALHVPFNSTSYNLTWPEDNCAMVCSVVEENPKRTELSHLPRENFLSKRK